MTFTVKGRTMIKQNIIGPEDGYRELKKWMEPFKRILLVCGGSTKGLEVNSVLEDPKVVRFSDFKPNPDYYSIVKGVEIFKEKGCDAVMGVGGGSAIDVAKCIKLYATLPGDGMKGEWLKAETGENGIPLFIMPTTAGTGSEATKFAVIYFEGVKQSVTDDSIIPGTVLMDPGALKSLPLYQRKCTMCDALCHAIEAWWSVNSTEESRKYSREAVEAVMKYKDGYLSGTDEGNEGMLNAAFLAGKAINIARTTAGHAMCYKITSIFGLSHGHSVMLCNRVHYPWMMENLNRCTDPRGEEYLKGVLDDIGRAMGCRDGVDGSKKLVSLFEEMELEVPVATESEIEEMKGGVNPLRMKNHPIRLDEETIERLYRKIVKTDR